MKKKIIISVLFCLLIISVSVINSCKKEENKGNIEGTITNAVTSEPVAGVTVTLSPNNASATTGSDGKYAFADIEEGDYTIQASKTGYQTNTKDVTVLSEQTRHGDIAITPNVPLLNVNVTSLDFGSNLTTLPIEIRNPGVSTLDWTITENIIWLSVNPISGSTTTQVSYINVTVDRTGLSQGNYAQSFSITSNGGNATIAVSLNIPNPNAPVVTCANAINITENTAEISGEITSIGSSSIIQHGHCWSTVPNPTTSDSKTTLGPTSATGPFTSYVTLLQANTTYYIRSYATNSNGTGYSTQQIFTTTSTPNAPIVTTAPATSITETSASITGTIVSLGSGGVYQHGHCWSLLHNPLYTDANTSLGNVSTTGPFVSNMSGLMQGITYYVRAYAINGAGIGYSDETSFVTLTPQSVPIITLNNITSITLNSALGGGNVTSDGGSSVTSRGLCWSISPNPTTTDMHTTDGNGVGSFNSSITGLNQGTTYYVRAYAVNNTGTGYSAQSSFMTLSPNFPTVTLNSITSITVSSAAGGGNVSSDGGASVTARGICWSTSLNPTTSNAHTSDGSGLGSFSSSLTGLNAATLYYVRAYATNSAGTSYSSQSSFTTSSPSLPSVSTSSISSIAGYTATGGGNVTNDGGATVTARGVCWSTSSNPTTTNSYSNDGSGTGSFNSSISGLNTATTYYVRAYASNSVGTAYGSQVSFMTVHVLGENFGGGIIFYVDGTGQHGLISTTSTQSTNCAWGCINTSISGASGTAIGTGLSNTNSIVAGCSESGIAAKICSDLVLSGYSDWYLPSKDELQMMYTNRSYIGNFPGCTTCYHWSSTEATNANAWSLYGFNGNSIQSYKGTGPWVRAIRSF